MLILSELRKGRPSTVPFNLLGFGGTASKSRPLGEGGYRVPYIWAGGVVAGLRIWLARSRQDAGATNHACATRSSNLL
jgi:hypothetical protein